MLDGLDEVPWTTLRHNYGTAEDVPPLLRAYAAGEEPDGDLLNLLYHQGGWICPAATAALPFLVELATAGELPGRLDALDVIETFAIDAPTLDPALIDEGWAAAWTAALPRLLPLLDDPDPAVRTMMAGVLSGATPAAEAAGRLRDLFAGEPLPLVRVHTIEAMTHLVEHSGDAAGLAWLKELCDNADPQISLAARLAVRTVEDSPVDADAVIEALRSATLDGRPIIRERWGDLDRFVQNVGSRLDGDPDAQVAVAMALLDDADPKRRAGAIQVATRVLARWRDRDEVLVPAVAARLDDTQSESRSYAARLLAAAAPAAVPYADQLADLLDDRLQVDGESVADAAAWALAGIGDERCLPVLRDTLEAGAGQRHLRRHFPDDHLAVGLPSIGELLELCPRGLRPALLPDVSAFLERVEDLGGRKDLLHTLAAWGPDAAGLAGQITGDLDGSTATLAVRALAAMGPDALAAVGPEAKAVSLLTDDDRPASLRCDAARAYYVLTGDGDPALQRLDDAKLTEDHFRLAAALGPVAVGHAERLHTAMAEQDMWALVEAAYAHWRVTGTADGAAALAAYVTGRLTAGEALPAARKAAEYLAEMTAEGVTAEGIEAAGALIGSGTRRRHFFGDWRAFAEDAAWRRAGRALTRAG